MVLFLYSLKMEPCDLTSTEIQQKDKNLRRSILLKLLTNLKYNHLFHSQVDFPGSSASHCRKEDAIARVSLWSGPNNTLYIPSASRR